MLYVGKLNIIVYFEFPLSSKNIKYIYRNKMYSNIYMVQNKKILKLYKDASLIPFSHQIEYNEEKEKKILSKLPLHSTINEYNKKYIDSSLNGLSIRTGTQDNDGNYIIVIDIDNKGDEEKIKNGYKKWFEMLKKQNINNFETPIQKTGRDGLHYLFKVNEEQIKLISNRTNLKIDNIKYSIDVRAINGFIIVEPSTYNDKVYKWLKYPHETEISKLPEWLFELIKDESKPIKTEIINNVNEILNVSPKTLQSAINNDNEIEIIQMIKLLSVSRLNDRNEWIKLGALIFSLFEIEKGKELFLEISRQSDKYENDEYIINAYNTIKKKQYNIETLYFWLKEDNPIEFNKIVKNKLKTKDDKLLAETIEINKRYLLDLDDNLDKDTILNNKIGEFFNDDNIKSFNLKAPYDTGKTQLIKKLIVKYEPKKILWLSYRISLTNDIKGNFKDMGFKSYLDGHYDAERLIIQLESLLKIDKNNNALFLEDDINEVPSFDLVIIDEVESVLSQFNSSTFKGYANESFKYLEEIINNSKKLITLDGDTSNRTYNFINSFGGSINIINNVKFNNKIFNVIDNNEIFRNEIYKSLDENKKIVVVCQPAKGAESLKMDLVARYPELVIMLYTSMTDDKIKMELEYVNKEWIKADVLIYSPTVEAGVNFDVIHFDKIFGILSNGSTSQRSFLQMLSRVRKLTDNEIIILNDKQFTIRNIKNYVTYEDAQQQMKEMNSFKMVTEYKTINNKRVKTINYDNYTTNFIYNMVEDRNKKPFYFLNKLKEIVESKGHIFNYEPLIKKKRCVMDENNLFLELVDTPLIKRNEYKEINEQKKKNNATREEKIKAAKYAYCSLLGLDNFDYDIIKTFYHKRHTIYNLINIIDKENYQKTNEAENKINLEKLELVEDIIIKLGFNNIFDNKQCITAEELTKQFKIIYENNKIFKCQKMAKLVFEISLFKLDDKTSIKKILGHLNVILNNYSLKITAKQIRDGSGKKYVYYIEIINNVDEIIKNRIERGFKLIDTKNIFKCSTNVFKEFIATKDIKILNCIDDEFDNIDDIDIDDNTTKTKIFYCNTCKLEMEKQKFRSKGAYVCGECFGN